MSIYVDPIDAAHCLAVAAAKVVQLPSLEDLGDAIDQLSLAVENYELTELSTPIPIFRPYVGRTCGCGETSPAADSALNPGIPSLPGRRFRAALASVDWRAQNPAGLADLLISVCTEVMDRNQIPNLDPAVRLVASKMATMCGLIVEDDTVTELICECTRLSRAKSR